VFRSHESGRIVAALTALVLAGCADQRDTDVVVAPAEGYVASRDDVRLYYRVIGSGDPVLVVHGGPGLDHGYLAPDLEPLAASYRLIFYDQRGAGRSTIVSDAPLLGLDAHIADLDAIRQHLVPDGANVLGHSWGAALAARYALAHPQAVTRLVLVSPGAVRYAPYERDLMARVTAWMDQDDLAELARREAALRDPTGDVRGACRAFFALLLRGYFHDLTDDAAPRRMRGDMCGAPDDALRNLWLVSATTMDSLGEYDWREDFRDLRVPTLLITGVRDVFPVESMREWEAAIPGARLVLLDRAGHFPHVEEPEAFFEAVLGFLE
jgi:proline iminopeptidase